MPIFFSSNQEQKKYVWKKINQIYPDFKTGGYFFRQFIDKNLNKEKVILDAGCGDNGIISEYLGKAKEIIGIDINKELLKKNKLVDKKILASLDKIPLKDNSIDLIVSEFVFEHLKNPEKVLEESQRILKKDGVLIFLTPNTINPIIFLSRFLPFFIHKFFRNTILKKTEETHLTFYRLNRYQKIRALAKKTKWQEINIKRAGNPEYLSITKASVPISIYLEKILNNKYLNIFQMYLIVCLKK